MRARRLGRDVELLAADARALPFDDEQFDTVVATLALCSISDGRRSVAEMVRVPREPGLQVEQCDRSKLGLVLRLAARKPDETGAWTSAVDQAPPRPTRVRTTTADVRTRGSPQRARADGAVVERSPDRCSAPARSTDNDRG